MKRKMLVIALLTVFALTVAASLSYADMGGYKSGGGKQYGNLEMKFYKSVHLVLAGQEELGLSTDQVKSIKALTVEVKKDLIQRNAKIETLGVEIKTMMWEAPFDVTDVNNLVAEKYKLKKDKAQYLISSIDKLHKTLTSEQLAKIDTLKYRRGK